MDNWRKGKGWLVFDVESLGLHGQGFSVGWVLLLPDGSVQEALHHCPIDKVKGDKEDYPWVVRNCDASGHMGTPPTAHDTHEQVLGAFWNIWMVHREQVLLAADVAWPVEARFLTACVDQNAYQRKWQGPYPLIDIASVRMTAGFDAMSKANRLPEELPIHNPLADARQSARLLREALGDRFFI